MILTTRGIILKSISYSETSVIIKVYTEDLGIRSYIIKGVRGGKNKIKQNILQPLSLLELTVYENPRKEIQQVKEIKTAEMLLSIPFDLTKMGMVFFLNELLYKSLKEPFPNKSLFHYIYYSVLELDSLTEGLNQFHLHFMLKLTHYLGFEPYNNYSEMRMPFFNIREGCFQTEMKDPLQSLNNQTSKQFHELINYIWKGHPCPDLNRKHRNELQEALLKYYEVHVEQFGTLQSYEIVKELVR